MKLAHMAWETSQGPPPPARPPREVRWGIRCSNSLSNSMVKATSACESSVASGSEGATAG